MLAGEINEYSLASATCATTAPRVGDLHQTSAGSTPMAAEEHLSTVVDITAPQAHPGGTSGQEAQFRFIFDSVPVGLSWAIARPG